MKSRGYIMAHGLQRLRNAVTFLGAICLMSLLASCILLRELEVETEDAGVSSPPVIVSAGEGFDFPGPITLNRDNPTQEIQLTIADNDIDDTMHVRMFLDYDNQSGAFLVSDCTAPASNTRLRTVFCPTDRICSTLDSADTMLHSLEVAVTDRDWLTAGDPRADGQDPLREVELPIANLVIRGWSMACQ